MESQADVFNKEMLMRHLRTAVHSWAVFSKDLQSLSELLGYEFPESAVMSGVQELADTEYSAWELKPSDLDNFIQELGRSSVKS
jgi:hypothetical protein